MTLTRTHNRARHASACGHCGSARMVESIRDLIECNRRRPLPGFGRMILTMKLTYGQQRLVAICPRCMCVTTDMTSNTAH